MNESKKMALLAVEALEDKKAEDITIIDISEVSVLADYFIIADGSNRNQVQAMADSAEEALGKAGYDAKQIEGYQSANWILMDYKDIIVHVFSKEDRAFYDLERIWRDGKEVDAKRILGVMGLGVKKDQEIVLKAEGSDEDQAIEKLSKFLQENL